MKVPITVDTNKYRGASVFQTKDGYMIRYDSWFPKLDPQLVMASPDGNIISHRSLPNLDKPQTVSLRERISEALSPLGTGIWQQVNVWGFHSLGMDDSTPFWTWKPKDRNEVLFSWMISALVGLACAGVLQLPLRRAEFRCQRLGWTLFVIFYGVAGLLVFWIANDWPRRIACPSCGRKRSVERETCEHCGAGWPAPKQDGTEIWEGLTEEATPPAAR